MDRNGGTLSKRKRRNIAKVTGLTTLPYSSAGDVWDWSALFSSRIQGSGSAPISTRYGAKTSLRMNSDLLRPHRTCFSRTTQNPLFHTPAPPDSATFANEAPANPEKSQRTHPKLARDRSHFLDKSSISRLQTIIRIGVLCGALPWSWNAEQYRIDRWSPAWFKFWKVANRLFLLQTICLFIFQIYIFYPLFFSQTHSSYRHVFMSSLSVLWYFFDMFFLVNVILYGEQMREYVNTMLQFNRDQVGKYLIHLDNYQEPGSLMMKVSMVTSIVEVLSSIFLFVEMPMLPWYLYSYVHPKPWYWLIPGMVQEFLLTGIGVTAVMLVGWLVVAHGNTVNFWLTESHNNNDSDYTTDTLRTPEVSIETYKSLQVLCTLFNECMSPLSIASLKGDILMTMIPCGYVLIRSMNHLFIEDFPGILSYPVGMIDLGMVGIGILSISARMNDLASSYIDSWSGTKSKDLRRLLISFPSLKVRVGSFYFITVSTTITFFQAIFGFITDAILTFP